MQNGPVLICFDLFCDTGKSLSTLVNELADDHVYRAILGFTPNEDRLGEYEKIEGKISSLSMTTRKTCLKTGS